MYIFTALSQLFHHDSARVVEMVEMVETCIFYYKFSHCGLPSNAEILMP